jgi:hypothetical protein
MKNPRLLYGLPARLGASVRRARDDNRLGCVASLVRAMRDHYLAVRCNCGAERVIGLEPMARDRRYANLTMAHVALRLDCSGCKDGPDEVYPAATPHGLHAPPGNGGILWTMPLVTRERHDGGRRMRFIPGVVDSTMIDELKGEFDIHHGTIPPPE